MTPTPPEMLDSLRGKLIELVNQIGPAISEEQSVCECFFDSRDKNTTKAIDALVTAIQQGVASELRQAKQDSKERISLERQVRQLCSVGVEPELASWAIESWAIAMGVSDRIRYSIDFKCPACKARGVSLKKIAGRTIKCPRCKSRVRVSIDGLTFKLDLEYKPVSTENIRSPGLDFVDLTTQIAVRNSSESPDLPLDSARLNESNDTEASHRNQPATLKRHEPTTSSKFKPVLEESANRPAIEFSNSIGMRFKLILPGAFLMGSATRGFESTISESFYLGVHCVTQKQYKEVIGMNPSHFRGPSNPVECVTWHDAVSFCRELSNLCSEIAENRTYRLPTESEWEYACRAGSDSDYCYGNDPSKLYEYAWFGNNFGKGPRYVGQKKPNAWGLYDMHGNVSEWCASRFADYPSFLPEESSDSMDDSKRTYRGGHWFNQAKFCRSAVRHGEAPGFRSDYLGFRVAVRVP